MSADLIIQLVAMLFVGAATYGAIRQDIKNIHHSLDKHDRDIDKAHERIDDVILGLSSGRKGSR